MGWLWLVGSIKLQVSFAKEPCKRDYSTKETCNLIEPTNRSHPIAMIDIGLVEKARESGLSMGGVGIQKMDSLSGKRSFVRLVPGLRVK